MRKLSGLAVLLLAFAALAATAAQAGKTRQNVTNLTFATYVWQPTTVAAVKNIVDSWNKTPSVDPGLDRPGRRELGARQAADDVRRRHAPRTSSTTRLRTSPASRSRAISRT